MLQAGKGGRECPRIRTHGGYDALCWSEARCGRIILYGSGLCERPLSGEQSWAFSNARCEPSCHSDGGAYAYSVVWSELSA